MKLTRFFALSAVTVLLLAACAPTESVHGNLLEDYQIVTVKPGTDTQSDVLRKLGSPTTKAPFDDNVWYYIGQDMEKKGILDPKITRERVVVVTFNTDGIVRDVQNVDNRRIPVPYVEEKTPTSGNDITIMQQLLGNLGKFNKAVPGEQP